MRKLSVIALVAAAGLALLPMVAEATVSYDINFVFSGDQPTHSGPWGTISFTTVGLNTLVTMSATGGATGLSSDEFISWWGFNSTAALSGLTIPTSVSGAANGSISTCDSGNCNAGTFKADGDGFDEIVVQFDTNGAGRLTAGESVSFTIQGATEGNFSPLSTGGNIGAYNTAVHIQGINAGGCSAWAGNNNASASGSGTGTPCTTTPEPNSLTTLAFSLLGLVFVFGSRRLGMSL